MVDRNNRSIVYSNNNSFEDDNRKIFEMVVDFFTNKINF